MDKKFYHKLELIYVKYSPMLIALGLLVNNILSYFNIYSFYEIGSMLLGVSMLTIGHMYNSSKVFKFCKYHRMFIHYILVNSVINMTDYFIGIPISNEWLFALYLTIAGIFLFLILYYHQKTKIKYDVGNKEITFKNS